MKKQTSHACAVAPLGALLFSGGYLLFYGSYLLRYLLVEDREGIAGLYDVSEAVRDTTLTFTASMFVTLILLVKSNKIPPAHAASKWDIKQLSLALLSIAALVVIRWTAPAVSYEGLHAFIGSSLTGKLLYLPYLYYSYLLGRGLWQAPPRAQAALELAAFTAAFTVLVPLRSPLLTHLLILVIVFRPSWRLFTFAGVFASALFVTMSLTRGTESVYGPDDLLTAGAMYLFGASLQIDLYELAKAHNIQSSAELYGELQWGYGDYFDAGGGFGSFLALELYPVFPFGAVLPLVLAIFPLAMSWAGTRYRTSALLVLCVGAQSLTILRNPVSSWINGFLLMITITFVAYVASVNRRHHL